MKQVNDFHLLLALIFLYFFGYFFNSLVDQARRDGRLEGYTWAAVAAGDGVVVLVGGLLLGLEVGAVFFLLFVAAGFHMVKGALESHWEARRQEQEVIGK